MITNLPFVSLSLSLSLALLHTPSIRAARGKEGGGEIDMPRVRGW